MITTSDTKLGRALADELLPAPHRVAPGVRGGAAAYEGWVKSDSESSELAYAGYQAALDQEEFAAEGCREQLAWVDRISG